MRMPDALSWKSGLMRMAIRGRMPRLSPASVTRLTSVSDSTSISTPAATAWRSSDGCLPGPAKLMCRADMPLSSATCISRGEAMSKPSTSPWRCCTTAGMGLALTA